MTTLQITGMPDPHPEPSELGRGLPGRVEVKHAVRVHAGRTGVPPVVLEGLSDDEVVEIELQDGLRIWTRVDNLPRDLAPRSRQGRAGGAIKLPAELTVGPASRAAGGWAIKALRVLGIDIEGQIADFVSAHVEGRLQPGPGLYRCAESDAAALAAAGSLEGKGPVLLFLHGTASSTSGSFGELWKPQGSGPIQSLMKQYDGRVLAYQHRTLTESPIENARALVRMLADVMDGSRELHVVSHSRGGLIGELLARGMRKGALPITPDDLALFEREGREKDLKALESLSNLLEETGLRVTRFVRVACPARGTTLADRRLDRYVSVLVNLASLIPGLRANPVYDGLTSLLAGVLKRRADPTELPGLEAMMPTSPLVRMLNRPDVTTEADLHALGGDLAGTGVFGRLKTLVTDFYYRDDHDLVVNTPAMLGGIERAAPIRYWIDTGDQVTHFHYFARPDTARRLAAALGGSSSDFRTLAARPSAVTAASYVKRAELSQPVVYVLPGIMGSQLSVADQPVWVNLLALARGGLSRLAPLDGVTATGLLPDGYGELCAYLAQTQHVVPFPYDWRLSIETSAALLQESLDRMAPIAERADQPIRLLAHSMGGLVVRAMLATARGRQTWERICRHPGARFVMLGTPNGGSHAIPALLIGRDALVKKLALLDLRSDHAGLLSTIAAFDGVLNLLPHAGTLDLFDRDVWERLLATDAPQTRGLFGSGVETSKSAGFRWTVPSPAALEKAKRLAAAIRDSPLSRAVYVAGVADETACDVVIDASAPEGRRVRVMATAQGDGRVPWTTGIPKNVPTFYMDTAHGDMANDRRHFAAIVDLLNTGASSKLPTAPPVGRGAEQLFELRDPVPDMVPDEAELVSAALGGRRAKVQAGAARPAIAVRLVHDNLTNARFPVLASHYQHDVIVAAEAYLDAKLNGRLSELLRMELYPGPINTGVVVLNEPPERDLSTHPGAIIAGLGVVGDLTPGSLTSTLAHTLTLYGADCVGRERRRQQREGDETAAPRTVSAPVTAILIGSGEGGVTLADSVRCLLRGVQQANQRLGGSPGRDGAAAGTLTAYIDRVDILELYEDRAIEALHVLRGLAPAPEFQDLAIDELLVPGAEGQRRARFDQAAGWWQRIRVEGREDGALEFAAVTQRAGAPVSLRPTQRGQMDRFVDRAIESSANDPKLGHTLFELLVPNDFKRFAPDRRKLALMLNPEAAAIPWELMHDGFDRAAEPLSVASGMVRQLLITDGRVHVVRPPGNTALVIGNPTVSQPGFPSLPGAAEEAAGVASLLSDSGNWDVQLLLDEAADPASVLTAIHEKPWRILHMAAHGVFEFATEQGKVSGLVLDDGLFFTAAEAEQLRYVPELVFINCCHLGQMRGEGRHRAPFHRLAANLATQFIRMGVRAVVAAGWEVDDRAALTFATGFYRRMLNGELYGDALLQARKDTHMLHGETNTWGAYQCYGDPSFSLTKGVSRPWVETFVAERELCIWLESHAARARADDARTAELLAALQTREGQTPAAWWASAEVCALAAQAYMELGRYERANELYHRALKAERANATLRAVEQLVNCKVRWAAALSPEGGAADPRAAELLEEAEPMLRHLLAFGETSERWSLLGSLMKRRALVAQNAAERRAATLAMRDAYRKAYDLEVANGSDGSYPLANLIAAETVLSWKKKTVRNEAVRAVQDLLKTLSESADALAASRTDAFSLSLAADRLLLLSLLERKLDDAAAGAIQTRYAAALSRGATPRQRDSIRTQLRFFRCALETDFPKTGKDRMIQQLAMLEEKLLGRGSTI